MSTATSRSGWLQAIRYSRSSSSVTTRICSLSSFKNFTRLTGLFASTPRNIRNTSEDPLYQTMLEGLTLYRFDVPDGEYEIELRFAEHQFGEAGRRVFDITFNGGPAVKRLDLAKEAGQFQAAAKKFRARAAEGRGVRVGFVPVAGRPLLSAVRIRRLGP